ILTLQQVPHMVGDIMLSLSGSHGVWLFMLLSIVVLIVMGSVPEGAAALIIFGPLLLPVAVKLGIDPLHFGVVLVISMGLGLFAPPLGLGLYGACLIGMALDDLLARADYVICLAVANEKTENLIGQAALARMQRQCLLHQPLARQS